MKKRIFNRITQKFEIINKQVKKKKMADHIHLYKRVDLVPKWKQKSDPDKHKPYMVYICTKPLCTHRLPLALAFGKAAECNKCGETFVMDRYTLTLARPKCSKCVNRKALPIEMNDLDELLKDI